MIRTVACSSCSTTFPVDPRKVPDEGVYARCSACSAVFFVEGALAGAGAGGGPLGGEWRKHHGENQAGQRNP